MKKYYLIVLISFLNFLNAQNSIKTFTNKKGNESTIFTYYQDSKTLETIKHGNFNYNNKSSNGKAQMIIKGKYSNGYKDGVWTWDIVNYNYSNAINYSKSTYKVIKTFKNGVKNGQWYYKKNVDTYQGNNLLNSFSWELNENFQNNILTGKLTYKDDNSLPIELNFNKDGALVGDYLLNYAGKLRLTTNQNGVVTRYEHGEETFINDETILVGEKFLRGEITKEQAEEKNISITKQYVTEYFFNESVFKDEGIKEPSDGEIYDGFANGYYVLSWLNPSLIKSKKERQKNELEEQKQNFKKLFIGRWKINGYLDKKSGKLDKVTNINCGYNILDFEDYGDFVKQEQEYLNKTQFGNSCFTKSIGRMTAEYNNKNNKIMLGDQSYDAKFNNGFLILESNSEMFKMFRAK